MAEEKKVQFRDLSTSLKTIVVISWIIAGFYALAFFVGFMSGVLGV